MASRVEPVLFAVYLWENTYLGGSSASTFTAPIAEPSAPAAIEPDDKVESVNGTHEEQKGSQTVSVRGRNGFFQPTTRCRSSVNQSPKRLLDRLMPNCPVGFR
jgi:hypothetical protein